MALMERKLKIPKDSLRFVIKTNSSKYDKKIRKYLISFLTSETASINRDTDFNLEELFLEANKYQLVTNVSIAKDLKCSVGTVSLCKTGKNRTKTAYKIKQYLEDIIEKGQILGTELPKDFNLEELFEDANKYQKVTISKIAKDLDFHRETISENIHGKRKGQTAYKIKEYLENIIKQDHELTEQSSNLVYELNLKELLSEARKYQHLPITKIAEDLNCSISAVSLSIQGKLNGEIAYKIREYLKNIVDEYDLFSDIREDIKYYENQDNSDELFSEIQKFTQEEKENKQMSNYLNLEELFKEANKYQKITNKQIAEELGCDVTTVSASKTGKSKGKNAYLIKEYLENIINQYKPLDEAIQQDSIQEKEQEQMTEETFTEDKEMKTYDNFLNFIDTQKELPIVKKALEETLKENQNLDKILAKEEFITIETALELNEKLFANEYTEEEILDFENQYFGTTDNASLNDKIKSFVEKHNLSLETALKLLQISEEDYKQMLEGADKISNKSADKIYKAISAFDEFYHSEKTQNTINNTKNTFVTGVAIASAKGQTFLNKGLNKFADFLNKSADKIKNSNSENKED